MVIRVELRPEFSFPVAPTPGARSARADNAPRIAQQRKHEIVGQQGGRGTTFALEHNFKAGQLAPMCVRAELYGG
jgi:hypothetical protein